MTYPPEILLRPKGWRPLGAVLGCVAFVLIGCLMVVDGASAGWPVIVLFGLAMSVPLLVLFRSYVRITQAGFTLRRVFRPLTYRWDEVAKVLVWETSRGPIVQPYVAVVLAEDCRRKTWWMRLQYCLHCFHICFPTSFGMTAHDLAALMDDYRQIAKQPTAPTGAPPSLPI
jgi:hypothetical protein